MPFEPGTTIPPVRPTRRPVQGQGREAVARPVRVGDDRRRGRRRRAQQAGDGRQLRRRRHHLHQGVPAHVRRTVPRDLVRGQHDRGTQRPRAAEAEDDRVRLRRRRFLQDGDQGRRRQGAAARFHRSGHRVRTQRDLGRLQRIDEDQAEEPRCHHRLGTPGRGCGDHQAEQGVGRQPGRWLRRDGRSADPGLRADAGRRRQRRTRVDPVDGEDHRLGQVVRVREGLQRHVRQAVQRPRRRVPRCRSDRRVPRARPRRGEGQLHRAGQGPRHPGRPRRADLLRPAEVQRQRAERHQDHGRDPGTGRQAGRRVAQGLQRGAARLARCKVMNQFLQATLYGLLQGGLLALVAVGFSLVWGVMNVVNLAHGAFVLGGAYVALELHDALGLDPFVSMVPAAAVLFALGYLIQRYLVNLVVNAPIFITLILTFGLEMVLENLLRVWFTPDYQSIPTGYAQDSLRLPGDIRIPYGKLIAALLAVAVTVALVYFMRRTRTGLSILATGMDRGAARLMGVKARHVYALTFGIAAAMAGAAGAAEGAVRTFSPADARPFT